MKYIFCLLLSFGILQAKTIEKKDCQHYISLCTIFNNESRYLKEWIEYHRLQGVEHFYLYNDSSTDDFMTVLKPYLEADIVDVMDWPRTSTDFHECQKTAYNHCIKKCIHKTFWLGIIDVDEFIVPVKKESLTSFLADYDHDKNIGAIKMNWQLYGTSFLKELPEGSLVTESFTLKAPDYYSAEPTPNHIVCKSLVRPHAVSEYLIHRGILKEKYQVLPRKKDPKEIHIDEIRLNHYWTRAEDFFYNVKIGRRLQTRDQSHIDVMMQKLIDLNQVEDKIIFRFLPELRQRMLQSP